MLAKPDWRTITTEEKAETIKALLRDYRLSAEMIARRFENSTRNAVISFCHRNGIKLTYKPGEPSPLWNCYQPKITAKGTGEPKPKKPKPEPKPRSKPKAAEPKAAFVFDTKSQTPPMDLPPAEPMTDTAVLFADATHEQCQWPLWGDGHGEELWCCGAPRDGESPYCADHRQRAKRHAA